MTANQKYKQSGSKKPFKVWLKEQQQIGMLGIHETNSFYADGSETTVGGVSTKTVLLVLLVGVAGYYLYTTYKK
jgi:hypothetical protein